MYGDADAECLGPIPTLPYIVGVMNSFLGLRDFIPSVSFVSLAYLKVIIVMTIPMIIISIGIHANRNVPPVRRTLRPVPLYDTKYKIINITNPIADTPIKIGPNALAPTTGVFITVSKNDCVVPI